MRLVGFLLLMMLAVHCGQASPVHVNIKTADTRVPHSGADTTPPSNQHAYFPFQLKEMGVQYIIMADLEAKDLYPKYYQLFEKHGYEGNGSCWEGHIRQILEKQDKELLQHISFDPEAGAFFANADSRAMQLRFVKVLSPIFSDLKKLEEWVKKADRSRIDD